MQQTDVPSDDCRMQFDNRWQAHVYMTAFGWNACPAFETVLSQKAQYFTSSYIPMNLTLPGTR